MNYRFYIACFLMALGFVGILLTLRKDKQWDNRKIARMGMFLAMAVALGMAESMLPDFIVPGFKLGLANALILILLYEGSVSEALWVDILRVLIVCLLRGTLFQMGGWMSMAGAALSFVGMLALRLLLRKKSQVITSVVGALLHDLGQILVAVAVLGSAKVFYYFPLMALLSILFGSITGVLALVLSKRKILSL